VFFHQNPKLEIACQCHRTVIPLLLLWLPIFENKKQNINQNKYTEIIRSGKMKIYFILHCRRQCCHSMNINWILNYKTSTIMLSYYFVTIGTVQAHSAIYQQQNIQLSIIVWTNHVDSSIPPNNPHEHLRL
jgi:hypothetical protein